MPVSYILGSNPIWNVFDLVGRPLGAGTLGTFQALNPTIEKPVYQDAGGTLAWTNPILFNENGQLSSPIYFADDAAYYLVVKDKNGNLVWSLNNYTPPGTGGGSPITTFQNLTNLVGNNVFYHNIGTRVNGTSASPVLAPGNHEGFTTPDTQFVTNVENSTSTISFPAFSLDNNPFSPDVTPEVSLNYTCSIAGSEAYNIIRLPINLHVNSLENTIVTGTIWGLGNSGNTQTVINIRQYMGQGGTPSADILTTLSTPTFTSTWTKYSFSGTIPALPGGTVLGTCGDDAVYLEIWLPAAAISNMNIAKPSLYIGSNYPGVEFITYDQIDSIISSPRTADARVSLNNFAPFGWVLANDHTIGSAASNATLRANIDTFQLFSILWVIGNAHNSYAPIFDSTGTPTTFGANAAADFNANKQMALTKVLGRAICSAGAPTDIGGSVSWGLGENGVGAQVQSLSAANLPPHTHTYQQVFGGTVGSGSGGVGIASESTQNTGNGPGNSAVFSIMNPSSFFNIYLKL